MRVARRRRRARAPVQTLTAGVVAGVAQASGGGGVVMDLTSPGGGSAAAVAATVAGAGASSVPVVARSLSGKGAALFAVSRYEGLSDDVNAAIKCQHGYASAGTAGKKMMPCLVWTELLHELTKASATTTAAHSVTLQRWKHPLAPLYAQPSIWALPYYSLGLLEKLSARSLDVYVR